MLGALALVTLLSGWRFGRITLLAAAGPALAAVGLWPLLPALAGLLPRWAERLWVAAAGVLATVAWQIGAGSDSFLAGGGFVGSAVADLDGEGSPPGRGRAPVAAPGRPARGRGAGRRDGDRRHVRAPGAARARRRSPRRGRRPVDRRAGHGAGGHLGRRRGRRGSRDPGRDRRDRVGDPALEEPPPPRPGEGVRYAPRSRSYEPPARHRAEDRGRLRAWLPKGVPQQPATGRACPQARPGDGGPQDGLRLAGLRAQRVHGLPVPQGPRGLRVVRAFPGGRAGQLPRRPRPRRRPVAGRAGHGDPGDRRGPADRRVRHRLPDGRRRRGRRAARSLRPARPGRGPGGRPRRPRPPRSPPPPRRSCPRRSGPTRRWRA